MGGQGSEGEGDGLLDDEDEALFDEEDEDEGRPTKKARK